MMGASLSELVFVDLLLELHDLVIDTLMGFWLSGITTNVATFIFTFMIAFLYLYAWCQQLIGCYAFKTLHLESVAAHTCATKK